MISMNKEIKIICSKCTHSINSHLKNGRCFSGSCKCKLFTPFEYPKVLSKIRSDGKKQCQEISKNGRQCRYPVFMLDKCVRHF